MRNGVPLVKLNFGECHSLGVNEDLIMSFIGGLEAFVKTVANSNMEKISLENHIFHFYKEIDLLFIFITENEINQKEIDFKMRKISSLFNQKYSTDLQDFNGKVSIFNDFKNTLIDMNLAEKNCGGRPECEGCPNSKKTLKFLQSFMGEKAGFFKRLRRKKT